MSLWLIFSVFATFCIWLCTRSSHRPGDNPITRSVDRVARFLDLLRGMRSEEHTSELQSLMRISYAVFCFTKKTLINLYLAPALATPSLTVSAEPSTAPSDINRIPDHLPTAIKAFLTIYS